MTTPRPFSALPGRRCDIAETAEPHRIPVGKLGDEHQASPDFIEVLLQRGEKHVRAALVARYGVLADAKLCSNVGLRTAKSTA